jgi:hypothetical protein
MGAVSYTFNQSASATSAIDLTDPAVNNGAAPMSTPRQGGFTLRNRVDCSDLATGNKTLFTVTAKSSASLVANTLFLMEVPKRTFVKSVTQKVPVGSTAPTTAYNTVHASGNSFASGAQLMLGAAAYTTSSQAAMKVDLTDGHAGVSSMDGAVFGTMPILKEAGTTALLPSAISSTSASATPWAGGVQWKFAGTDDVIPIGRYFPFGGFVTLTMGPDAVVVSSASSAHLTNSSTTGTMAGVWDFMATCEYLPE